MCVSVCVDICDSVNARMAAFARLKDISTHIYQTQWHTECHRKSETEEEQSRTKCLSVCVIVCEWWGEVLHCIQSIEHEHVRSCGR